MIYAIEANIPVRLPATDEVLRTSAPHGSTQTMRLSVVRRAAMPDQKNSKQPDYVVGYRRPPEATRFTAGTSGNPKGRPKGSRAVGAVFQDIIRQKVAVAENGKTRRIPAIEVMFRRLANDAMRSDPRAMKLLLSLVDRYADSPETALKLGKMLAEDREILAQYLQEPAGLGAEAARTPDDEERGGAV
jgi:hypothetical protein